MLLSEKNQAINVLKSCSAVSFQDARAKMVDVMELLPSSAPEVVFLSLKRGLRYGEDMRSSQQLNIDDAIKALVRTSAVL